jgi:hypothetical protein
MTRRLDPWEGLGSQIMEDAIESACTKFLKNSGEGCCTVYQQGTYGKGCR